MAFQVVVTDLDGRELAYAEEHDGVSITQRLNGYVDVALSVHPSSSASGASAIARRALKIYDGSTLRFFGKVWEPLTRKPTGVSVGARSPLAVLAWRRVEANTDYTATNNAGGPWDAGAIARNRIEIQNARANTRLRCLPANVQASVNRIRSYNPGKREDEILQELADAAGGFFYREQFLDDVAGYMADLLIRYPDAGVTRPGVRFEYGAGTLANVADYEHIETTVKNRVVAAGGQEGGGRITQTREDAASIAEYDLFEDELVFSEQAEPTILLQAATAEVRSAPPATVQLTPAADSPLLFRDFDVGDFVRVLIDEPPAIAIDTWARVLEATLHEDKQGSQTLTGLTLELQAGQAELAPHRLFRARLDEERRRLEALERRVEQITAATPDLASTGAPSGGGDAATAPAEPPPPDAPPAPTPQSAPSIAAVSAAAESSRVIRCFVDGDGNGLDTTVHFEVRLSSETGPLTRNTDPAVVGAGGFHHEALVENLERNTTYAVRCHAVSSAGQTSSGWISVTTLDVDFF